MQLLFGGLISVVLLGVYVHLVRVAIKVVYCVAATGCTDFNEGMAQALSVIGGLVSALVIAELAITKPGEAPARRKLAKDASPLAVRTVSIVSTIYVLVWISAGLTAFLVGLYHPKEVPPLTTLGQAWLGLAVSAAYAYFGIKPVKAGA
jgi:ABC-type thiamin/hydroxymethylpyrimidine transport system permease subunit